MKYRLLLLAVITLAAAGCTSDRDASPPPPAATTHLAEPADAIDKGLMIALLQAKNFHHKAKVYMSDGNLDAAIASVREVLSLPFPPGAAEAEDVRNDARALLAKLLVEKGQLDEAMRVVQEGIAQSARKSFFVANLYTVEGEIHEARAAQLEAGGGADAKAKAVEEKRAAIESYDTSIQIDKKLQDSLVEDR
jgi:tetratricopeptide (TPR) repeat protein